MGLLQTDFFRKAMTAPWLVAASIAMLFVNKSMRGDYLNWTIDFKGGTEMVFAAHAVDRERVAVLRQRCRAAETDAARTARYECRLHPLLSVQNVR